MQKARSTVEPKRAFQIGRGIRTPKTPKRQLRYQRSALTIRPFLHSVADPPPSDRQAKIQGCAAPVR